MQRGYLYFLNILKRPLPKRSEWPILPIIWPFLLVIPSIALTEPFGLYLESMLGLPSKSTYWVKIWPLSRSSANSSAVTTNLPSPCDTGIAWMSPTSTPCKPWWVGVGNTCFHHLSHVLVSIIVEEGWTRATFASSKLPYGRPDLTRAWNPLQIPIIKPPPSMVSIAARTFHWARC